MNHHRFCHFACHRIVVILVVAAFGVASYIPAAATVVASPPSHPTFALLRRPALAENTGGWTSRSQALTWSSRQRLPAA